MLCCSGLFHPSLENMFSVEQTTDNLFISALPVTSFYPSAGDQSINRCLLLFGARRLECTECFLIWQFSSQMKPDLNKGENRVRFATVLKGQLVLDGDFNCEVFSQSRTGGLIQQQFVNGFSRDQTSG